MKKVSDQAGTRPVPATKKLVHRGKLLAATALAPVELEGVGAGDFRLKMRPNGRWAVFDGGIYVVSTKTRDLEKAQDFLELFAAQAEAKRAGELDVRFADATEVVDEFLATKGRCRPKTQAQIESVMRVMKPFLAGKTVRQLDEDWLAETQKALKQVPQRSSPNAKKPPKVGYADTTICLAIAWLTVAIMAWCRKHRAMPFLPFRRPAQPAGRDAVFSSSDQKAILRWARGTESYDLKTGKWTEAEGPLKSHDLHARRMIDRMFTISLATGSRPGNVWGLATEESLDTPYIDLEEETLYRVPVGERAPNNKLAPAVKLSPATIAEVRRFIAEDGPGETYLLRTLPRTGKPARPLSQRSCADRWQRAMRKLGIKGTRHVCRHTTVTGMVRRNVPAIAISATCGMSLRTIKNRYNHTADRDVQPIAHAAIDALLAKGIGISSPKQPQ